MSPGPTLCRGETTAIQEVAVFSLRKRRADHLAEYLVWFDIEKGARPSSINIYRRELELLQEHAGRSLEILTFDEIQAYVHARGGAASTVGRRISALRSFYGYLVLMDVRADDPTRKLTRPKIRKRLPGPVKDADALFLELDPTAQLIAIFLRETGLRIAEACSLNIESPAPKVIRIIGKGDKERKVPLNRAARASLDYLGGSMPLRTWTIQRRFRKLGFSPHRLRHTFASEHSEAGTDLGILQELMGHESPATTKGYVSYSEAKLLEAVERRRA